MTTKFAIIGAGKVGVALARLLAEAGYSFLGAASRSLASAEKACRLAGSGVPTTEPAQVARKADLVFITTPDDAIQWVADESSAAGAFKRGAVVAHCSGALPSTILASVRAAGAHVGSLHPLQSFATVEQAVQLLPGSYCCIEGDPEAAEVLEQVARALGARALRIPTDAKALYHASAVLASNYLVALQNAALRLGEAAGIDRADALQSLLPLIKGTVSNLESVGIPDCLTGPIARGDVETVRRHLDALEAAVPELLPLYKVLGREAVQVALAKGTLTRHRAAQLLGMLA